MKIEKLKTAPLVSKKRKSKKALPEVSEHTATEFDMDSAVRRMGAFYAQDRDAVDWRAFYARHPEVDQDDE